MGKYINKFINFIFPNYCNNCNKLLTENDPQCFCNKCWNTITLIKDDFCIKCGKPIITSDGICSNCKNKTFYYHQIRAAGVYEDILKDAIHLYKYSFRWKLVSDFINLIDKSINSDFIMDNQYIAPVPVTGIELKRKGFHHIFSLTKYLSKKYNIPVIKNLIKKIKNTKPQSQLKKEERLTNLKDCFIVNKKYNAQIYNKTILLCDDVYTTGSTVQEISKELRKHSIKKVNILTIARGR